MQSQTSQKKPKYKVMITILGNINQVRGNSFSEACKNLNMSWKDIKGRGLVTVWKEDKKVEKMFNAPQLRRLVSNPVAQHIWERNFELLLE